jgi:hypothetical protein
MSSDNSDKLKKLIKFYDISKTNSDQYTSDQNTSEQYNHYSSDIQTHTKMYSDTLVNNVCCLLCNTTRKDNYIILNCNDIFHITCLVDYQSDFLYNCKKMDDDFLLTLKCPRCSITIQSEDLLHLHNKYLGFINTKLKTHSTSIDTLESQLRDLQKEISNCYNYKHKLECDKDKSKTLVKTLFSLLP